MHGCLRAAVVIVATVIGTFAVLFVVGIAMLSWSFKDLDADVCERSEQPILAAARVGDVEGVVSELDDGVSPDVIDNKQNTPLGCAIPTDQEAVVRVLLDRGADPSRVTGDPAASDDEYPLELAMNEREIGENRSMAALLLARGADPNMHTSRHPLPLRRAMASSDRELSLLLLDHGAHPDGDGDFLPLVTATKGADEEFVNVLLDRGADPNGRPTMRPLAAATTETLVDSLVRRGADPTMAFAAAGPETVADRALGTTAATGDVALMRRWLALGADPDRSPPDQNPLTRAVAHRHTEAASVLLDAGADADRGAIDPAVQLREAFSEPNVDYDLYGFDVATGQSTRPSGSNPTGPTGTLAPVPASSLTPLILAASFGDAEMVTLLTNHGAAVDHAPGGATPLYYAARGCHADVVAILLTQGADRHGAPGTYDPSVGMCETVQSQLGG